MSAKITQEQANELLTLLGVQAVVVDNTEDNPADENVNLQDLVKTAPVPDEDFIKAKLKGEVEDELKASFDGYWIKSLRSKIAQQFGVKTTAMADMKIEDMLSMAKGAVEEGFSKSQKDWIADRQKLIEAQEQEKEGVIAEYESKLRQSEEKYIRRDKKERCIQLLNSIPRSGGDVTKQAEALLTELESNYAAKFDGDNKIIGLFDKSDPTRPIFKGKKLLSDEDVALNFAEQMGWKVNDTRNIKPSDAAKKAAPGIASMPPSLKSKVPANAPEAARKMFEMIEAANEAEGE